LKALIIVDHGSRLESANNMLQYVADLVRQASPKDLIVDFAHMELAEPNIEQTIDKCVELGASEIVVHPYMLSPGRHATKDIPELVFEAAKKHPEVRACVTKPLGLDKKIAEVILDRAGIAPQKQSPKKQSPKNYEKKSFFSKLLKN